MTGAKNCLMIDSSQELALPCLSKPDPPFLFFLNDYVTLVMEICHFPLIELVLQTTTPELAPSPSLNVVHLSLKASLLSLSHDSGCSSQRDPPSLGFNLEGYFYFLLPSRKILFPWIQKQKHCWVVELNFRVIWYSFRWEMTLPLRPGSDLPCSLVNKALGTGHKLFQVLIPGVLRTSWIGS